MCIYRVHVLSNFMSACDIEYHVAFFGFGQFQVHFQYQTAVCVRCLDTFGHFG